MSNNYATGLPRQSSYTYHHQGYSRANVAEVYPHHVQLYPKTTFGCPLTYAWPYNRYGSANPPVVTQSPMNGVYRPF